MKSLRGWTEESHEILSQEERIASIFRAEEYAKQAERNIKCLRLAGCLLKLSTPKWR
jgi:hypothetical protein